MSAGSIDTVTLTIDGIEVSVPKGTLVIRAAERIGVPIPRFCDHPLLSPVGACRQCLVEIATPGPDGTPRPMPKPQASCTIEATPGMVVRTQVTSPVADKAQRAMLEFLLINHPLDCPVCDKGGECPLQNQAMSNGRSTSRFLETKRTFPKPIRISTQVLLDRERCVLCQRCTRFSAEIAGDVFIDLQMRGAQQQIGTFSPTILGFHSGAEENGNGSHAAPELPGGDVPPEVHPPVTEPMQGAVEDASRGAVGHVESGTTAEELRPAQVRDVAGVAPEGVTEGAAMLDASGQPFASYFSGNTVQICPVGALTGAAYRFRSRPFDLVSVPGVCEHCASGCAQRTDHRRGVVLRRLAGDDPQVNREWNCDKGRWAFTWATAADRLTSPLVRDPESGRLEPASWPQALDVAARGLAAARARGVGVLVGGRATVEDAYAYGKFARVVLGTNDVDFRCRQHSTEEAQFLAHAVAGRGIGVEYADLDAAPVVLLAGFEPEEESPIVFLRLREGVNARRLRVHALAPWASRGLVKLSGTLIPAAPGTEAEVLDAIGAGDEAVAELASGLREQGAVILVGERMAAAPGALSAVLRLATATGARLAWVPRRAGERGALDAGALPGLLPGGRPVADAAARVDVAAAWEVPELPADPGRQTAEILAAAADGDLGGLVVGGIEPDDLPDPVSALAGLHEAFVVSLEVRASAVTERADVVLPVAPAQEKAGTFVDWEGRPRPFPAAMVSSNAMPDYRVLDALADAMGADLGLRGLEHVRAELTEFGAWEGARAPAPSTAAPGLAQPTAGQAVLATWRLLLDAGRLQDGEPYLAGTAHRSTARMSAATAAEAGIADGDAVRVAGPRGAVTLPVVLTPMPDRVVWVPTNSAGCAPYVDLGVGAGGVVDISGVPAAQVATLGGEVR
jgi:NADH-quinone oxidoreductase subunit G